MSQSFLYKIKNWMLSTEDAQKKYKENELLDKDLYELNYADELKYFGIHTENSDMILGKYKIRQKLGEGAFGVVYKCELKNTSECFAVKILDLAKIKKDFKFNDSQIMNEINLLAEIKSDYVIRLVEFKIMERNLYLVCEMFEGMEILDYLDSQGPTSEKDAKKIVYNIMKGVKHIHSKNIIHRDLKLENILVNVNETDKVIDVKIIDLGLGTKLYYEAEGFFGTPNYMPPEVFKKSSYDYKFDVFSIGVILWTMLLCEFPFQDENLHGLADKIKHTEPNYRLLKAKPVSAHCIDLIKKLLAKDPKQRATLDEAIDHEWFIEEYIDQNDVEPITAQEYSNVLYSLKTYKNMNKLMKAFKVFNLRLSNVKSVRKYRDYFLKYDSDNNGYLDYNEFTDLMKFLSNDSITEHEIRQMHTLIDINLDGKIEYDEFLAIFAEHSKFNEDLLIEYAFTNIDEDNSGTISPKELHKFLKDLNTDFSDNEIKEVLEKMDINGDGEISIAEFKYHLKLELKKKYTDDDDQEEEEELYLPDEEADCIDLNGFNTRATTLETKRKTNIFEGKEFIEFVGTKEPRHQLGSSFLRKKRLFRVYKTLFTYYDPKKNDQKGEIILDSLDKIIIWNETEFELKGSLKRHYIVIENYEMKNLIEWFKICGFTNKIEYTKMFKQDYGLE